MIDDSITRIITAEELAKHNQDDDTWFAINGYVYDASEYLKEHPGGRDAIILASGDDASEDFLAIHSNTAKSILKKYHIGILESSNTKKTNFPDEKYRDIFLNRKQWSKTMLKIKKKINNDTYRLTFELEHPNQKLGVPIGKHLYLQCISSSGEKIIRSYTPISDVDQLGQFELIIKVYKASKNQPAGKMSECIERLIEGDIVQCKGPFGDVEYQRNRIISNRGMIHQVNKLTMIAGGSGITPIYQIFRYAIEDGIECEMIYCNKTEEDILLRNELEYFQEIRHCLSRSNENWKGCRGYVSKDIIGQRHDGLLLCCGPSSMEKLVKDIAEQIGWDMQNQFILF
jgi:nitrate reductase (NAD(P)H)